MNPTDNPIVCTQQHLAKVLAFINQTPWRDMYAGRLTVLSEKADMPCELAIAGRVKAGKSSFLNALIGEDLAMVGVNETTATINFFKYGFPRDASHPVKVVWDDGHEEWQTREFLDSLQGNTKEILDKAQKIDHLEYFVNNPILHNVTLVDTPGTGALVDEHEERVNDYLCAQREKLREKHSKQSVQLKDRADAVVIVTGRVPQATTNEMVAMFNEDSSAFNTIGVMTKIDLEEGTTAEDWQRRCKDYMSMLRQQLSNIIPVSAGVYRTVMRMKRTNAIATMQEVLRKIPEMYFDKLMSNSNIFMSDSIDDMLQEWGISRQEKSQILSYTPDWRVFYTIATEVYRNDLSVAEDNLIRYSGMETVKKALESQFFTRSRVIRCARIMKEVHAMLEEIRNEQLYHTRSEVYNRDTFLNIIEKAHADIEVRKAFRQFVEKNICTRTRYDEFEKRLAALLQQTESIQQSFSATDKFAEALLLLKSKRGSFRDAEIKELEALFSKSSEPLTVVPAARQNFWRGRLQQVADQDVKQIVKHAIYAYGLKK